MMGERTIIDLAEALCQYELCCSNQHKTVTVMVHPGLLRCLHSVRSVGVQMPALSNTFLTALASIKSVQSLQPDCKIWPGLRISAKTAEGVSK